MGPTEDVSIGDHIVTNRNWPVFADSGCYQHPVGSSALAEHDFCRE